MFGWIFDGEEVGLVGEKIVDFAPRVFAAIVLLVVFWVLARLVKRALGGVMQRAHMPQEAIDVLVKLASASVFAIGAVTVASNLGINVGTLIAGLGVAGLAVSFAAQDTIGNIISGITLLIDRPFQKGDWVQIGDVHANVTAIRLRTTVMTTFDNETIVLPNRDIAHEKIINYTLTPKLRCRVSLGIAYKEDTRAAREVMLSTLEGDERIMPEPKPLVIVTGLGDSSVNMQMRFWVQESLIKFPMEWEYLEKCKHALDEADIQIPYPHLQLFLERTEALRELAGTTGT